MTAPHPAKWSEAVLDAIGDNTFELLADDARILDPFAGVGIERLAKVAGELPALVCGVELEAEWLPDGGDMVQANSLHLPFRSHIFDAVITSPAYGNRMADSHDAQERCKPCAGTGELPRHADEAPRECEKCGGTGHRDHVRNTYKAVLGRDPSPDSSTTMQWGDAYRRLHAAVWRECDRVLKPGALVLLNVSNHIRAGRERHVAEWHLNEWMLLGARVHHVERIPTPRLGFGQNGDARVDGELLVVLQTRPA